MPHISFQRVPPWMLLKSPIRRPGCGRSGSLRMRLLPKSAALCDAHGRHGADWIVAGRRWATNLRAPAAGDIQRHLHS
jgi:hypothetical protein